MRVIVSPQEDIYVAVLPGARAGMRLPSGHYEQIAEAASGSAAVPQWFAEAAHQAWRIDLAGQRAADAVAVRSRPAGPVTYSRATWEINKGCNFSCEHCYLEQRPFAGLSIAKKLRLIDVLADMGVLWFQITGGEPLIDPDFPPSYLRAHDAGMMIEILTNGSRLAREGITTLFATALPHKITVSMYGASPETADTLTQTRGAFQNTYRGLLAAKDAGLPVEVTIIVTRHNVDELEAMRALIDELGFPRNEYGSISPTYTGKGSPLTAQAKGWLNKSAVFDGCPAGHTFFHVDPHGMATMCKVGRDNPISLIAEGPEGLLRLPAIADAQMLRAGGCTGCTLSSSCRVCRPMARVYQEAKAPLENYCQHGERKAS
jgi:MoaA/NifB/PqqE/SkfB family radical SAM enzyme